ncbi:hypothetical protein O9H85_29805 [Paenibacillus filicis]|uniref:DUF2231 domain-containing protein n=1 Tax=Paenibacillus gyeongsangnamensis TaxID=3388067 RepID=A0ABT4QI01_9BACL|nr:hypothetical protein [Paenibacillus filicis]MCZ8516510.1 hypothetical protein [Paenibacillus filicis]
MLKPAAMRDDTKHALMSVIPIGLALVLHTVHLLLAPALLGMGAMAMSGHHHHDMSLPMTMGDAASSAGASWITIAFLVLNGIGIYYAGRVLWKSRSVKSTGRHGQICKAISVATIVIGVVSGVSLI